MQKETDGVRAVPKMNDAEFLREYGWREMMGS